MAKIKDYEKLTVQERQSRYFSEEFRRKKVSEIERGITTISEISREYQLSKGSVYKWIYKYSLVRKKGMKMIVEAKSDTRKITQFREEIKELECLVGQKQVKIDFLEKMIELAEEKYGIEIKKNFFMRRWNGFGVIEKNTHTK